MHVVVVASDVMIVAMRVSMCVVMHCVVVARGVLVVAVRFDWLW